jgi:hypothetical protein
VVVVARRGSKRAGPVGKPVQSVDRDGGDHAFVVADANEGSESLQRGPEVFGERPEPDWQETIVQCATKRLPGNARHQRDHAAWAQDPPSLPPELLAFEPPVRRADDHQTERVIEPDGDCGNTCAQGRVQ